MNATDVVMPAAESATRSVVELLAVACLVAIASKRVRMPYTVALVLVGIAVGFFEVLHPVVISKEVLLLVFLPPLLFRGDPGHGSQGAPRPLARGGRSRAARDSGFVRGRRLPGALRDRLRLACLAAGGGDARRRRSPVGGTESDRPGARGASLGALGRDRAREAQARSGQESLLRAHPELAHARSDEIRANLLLAERAALESAVQQGQIGEEVAGRARHDLDDTLVALRKQH